MLEFFKKLFGRADVNKDGKVDAVDTADIAIAQLPDPRTAPKPAAKEEVKVVAEKTKTAEKKVVSKAKSAAKSVSKPKA